MRAGEQCGRGGLSGSTNGVQRKWVIGRLERRRLRTDSTPLASATSTSSSTTSTGSKAWDAMKGKS